MKEFRTLMTSGNISLHGSQCFTVIDPLTHHTRYYAGTVISVERAVILIIAVRFSREKLFSRYFLVQIVHRHEKNKTHVIPS